jgi:hypothetical protein
MADWLATGSRGDETRARPDPQPGHRSCADVEQQRRADRRHRPHRSHEAVQLGSHQFYRNHIVLSSAGDAPEVVYALPTTGKTVLGYCITSLTSVQIDCEGMLGTLQLSGLQALPVGTNAAYAAALSSIMLQTRGAIEGAGLSGATNASDQAAAAASISRTYKTAATAVSKLTSTAGPSAAAPNANLVTALGALGKSYGDLGTAAANDDATGYAAAARAITNQNAALGSALGQLAAAGYTRV